MVDRLDEQLLGYLLGALEDSEQQRLEEQLAADPSLRQELVRLRETLKPIDAAAMPFEPPAGLADRACRRVARFCRSTAAGVGDVYDQILRPAPRVAAAADVALPAVSTSTFGWKDLAVAAAVLMAATFLLFPALVNSRFDARVAACGDNLRRLGQALATYSQNHNDYFPPVAERGPLAAAGAFAPLLASAGYLESPRWLICPASELAKNPQFQIPSLEDLATVDNPVQLANLQSRMGGSYGYSLGFVEDGRYQSRRNLRRPYFALMSDAPSHEMPGYQSLNHGGRGQNVLFEDFHVEFFSAPEADGLRDRFFVNDDGQIAPGRQRNDSVIAGSGTPPIVNVGLGSR